MIDFPRQTPTAVTILGQGQSSHGARECIGDIWACNGAHLAFQTGDGTGPRIQYGRYFELHTMAELDGAGVPVDVHLAALDGLGCPVYMQAPHPAVCRSVAYPVADVVRFFRSWYFTGTPQFMLALALMEGVRHIRTWGIDQLDPAHVGQRTGWAAMILLGRAMGATIDGHISFEHGIDQYAAPYRAYAQTALAAVQG